ncbi:YihY/virulence factor BrkB family protein [Butyricicoccus faecihominis]|uniref:YihY/virulence factor BrkB family protein n=1 Tax=Butyricicoccaceae TaxID=3085642 RepID=UPI002479C138|nr:MULTISPECIES: YihY/virulence factor BrkB family protein [Butyricicoccaceae]MCQ5128057.1 YihY/virulence factor BrkB family protein [Butyricicoccus faecihominis]WNX86364.1 YihY/virulence factor BrkB family protein [Agathobaculum sp. NTUH-O15-33]
MNGQNRLVYLIKRMVYRYFGDGIPQAAAELSYFLLFSLAPLLMFINSLLAQLHLSMDGIQPILQMLPQSLNSLIESYLEQLRQQPAVSPMIIGIVLTLYFLSRAVRSMMRTVNDIYHIEVKRGMVMDVLISFGITAGFLISVVVSFVLVVAGRTLLRLLPVYLPIPEAVLGLTHDASFWVMIAFIFGFLLLFNRVVPNLYLKFREVWPGALFSLLAWLLVSWAFSFYVDNMARYSVLYGSLGAIIVLMLWLYLVSMILLMGPQLNHTLVVMRLYRIETGRQKQ